MKFKRFLTLALALLMLFGGLPVSMAMDMDMAVDANAPQDYVQALSRLAAAHWSDDFFAKMTIEAGTDGGEILLPRRAVAQVRELPAQLARSQEYVTVQQAQALGLDVDITDGAIVVTAPYQTRRLLVGTETGQLNDTHGAIAMVPLSGGRFALQYETEEQARRARLLLEADPGVRYAEPDGIMQTHAVTEEQEIAAQASPPPSFWNWGRGRIGAPAFQAILPARPPDITVAVIDTGVDVNHPVFEGRVSTTRWNFVDNNNDLTDRDGHGTHVAGIVADATSPNVQVMPLRVFGSGSLGIESLIIEALRFAANNGAQIANMSFGGPVAASNSWAEAILYVQGRGMHLVASAGNSRNDRKNFPAAMPGVIAVASSTRTDALAGHSNWGHWVDIGAPGSEISSASAGSTSWRTLSGTSMAAAHVSAAAALLLSHNSNISNEDMLPTMVNMTDPWRGSPVADGSAWLGAGIINLAPRHFANTMLRGISESAGGTRRLQPSHSPPTPGSFTFTSSDPNIAAVSPGGIVFALRPGTAAITVQGPNGESTNVNVTVTGRPITEGTFDRVSLLSSPTQTRYAVGDRLNTAGGRIRLHFSDGNHMDFDLLPEHVAGFNPRQIGTQTLTVDLSGRTATFNVTVGQRASSVSIVELPRQLVYRTNERVDLTGGRVRITYADGSTEVIPMTHYRVLGTPHSGAVYPNGTGFDQVRVVVDGFATVDFWVVYVNANGMLDGLTGSGTLLWRENIALPTIDSPYVRWHSSNPAVITVNADGTINYFARGSTVLTLVFEPSGHQPTVVSRIDATVAFTLWQWILWIFAFGWIWM